jgi:hypothetical protein
VRRHDLDLTSLVAGLVFVALAAVYLVGSLTDVHIGWRWVVPLLLIGLGVAGLAGSLRSGLRRPEEPAALDETAPPTDDV